MRTVLILILYNNLILAQTSGEKKMNSKLKMTIDEFNKIGPYDDTQYLTFNYEETLFEHIRERLLNPETFKETYKNLTNGQKILWGYISISSQIRNGGIAQYYWNTDGVYIGDTNLILEVINNNEFSKIFNKYKDLFIKNKELLINYKSLDVRQEQNSLTKSSDRINYYELWYKAIGGDDLNKLFFSNTVEIEKRIYDYVTANPKEFIN